MERVKIALFLKFYGIIREVETVPFPTKQKAGMRGGIHASCNE
jgi:hypothetical protein